MIKLEANNNICANFPDQPAALKFSGATSLFDRQRLVELANTLDPHLVEYNSGDLPLSVSPQDIPAAALPASEIIDQIGEANSWMTLRNIERDAEYRKLAMQALAPLEETIVSKLGPLLQREAFIFISSPNAVTPFHIDEEHNILIQIEGEKTVTVYSQDDRALASQTDLERFHAGGHRNLALDPLCEGRGQKFRLAPGDALYIPPLAPHWVKVGPHAPAHSLSVTWRSRASRKALYLHQINHRLRARGFNPRFPGDAPVTDQLKIWGASGLARLERLAGA